MYIATGVSLARPPRLHRALDILFPAKTLLDYREAELAAQIKEEPEEDTVAEGPPPQLEIPKPEELVVPVSNSYKAKTRLLVVPNGNTWRVKKTERLTGGDKSFRLVVAGDSTSLVAQIGRLARLVEADDVADMLEPMARLIKCEFHYREGRTGEGFHRIGPRFGIYTAVVPGYGVALDARIGALYVPRDVLFDMEECALADECC